MAKIFGLDLGTNSIGWALRNDELPQNQIEKFGVLTFKKGVGLGKTGEYSYAAERTKKRSVRRLYQARKYRLWQTLEHLINEGFCPLSIDDLNKWRHYNKQEALKNNNAGRVYPVDNADFEAWIKLDFNRDGKPDYSSPIQLRAEIATTKLDLDKEINRFKFGRALYHIAQRRGFKSSRKVADEPEVKEIETQDEDQTFLQKSELKKSKQLKEIFPDLDEKQAICIYLAKHEREGKRIREDVTQHIVRAIYKHEVQQLFKNQGISQSSELYKNLVETGPNKNNGSIFYKRPLRSQKGLVGKCTLEPNKYRIPISHPSFEIFRAWSFLNNIKYKENNAWNPLPLGLKQELYNELFFRKSKPHFDFYEIRKYIYSKGKDWKLNYSDKTTVSACPVSARLKDIFGEDYQHVRIEKPQAPRSSKNYYDIQDIWHVLFNYEDEEYVSEFGRDKLKLNEEQLHKFIIAWNKMPVGYGMLSANAINKINVFLEKGLIYTEAVMLANVPEILGSEKWEKNQESIIEEISNVIASNRSQKTILNVANNLISKYKNSVHDQKYGYKNKEYKLDQSDVENVKKAIEETFGSNSWIEMPEAEKSKIFTIVKDLYQGYFSTQGLVRNNGNSERIVTISSNNQDFYRSETGYFIQPRLIDSFGEYLIQKFNLDITKVKKLYHPSEINIYPPAKEDKNGVLKLGSPKTGSFKNPMAMRTLHELRKLINFMIETKQIDNETRIVVEVARDLNDSNRRWAIEAWQKQRESENKEFAKAIEELLKTNKNIKASPENDEDIDKVRLFYEQNTEHDLPEVVTDDSAQKGKKKIAKGSAQNTVPWAGLGKNLINKYRLWVEQGFQCMYTGRMIKLTDLFDENTVDFEHTIPRSISFDNSLANRTVCYADYNRNVKKNLIPTQLPNYEEDTREGTAIVHRLEHWKDKVERIQQQIEFWKAKSKKAQDKDNKDRAIRQKHLWGMELDYWKNKLERFTITEITTGFKNSQLVDTQLITKYAFHYLKSYFDRVDVQKGSVTSIFRKIYGLQVKDKEKDRSKHSHHAKDAAVLTLIPVAVQRDKILEEYYLANERKLDVLKVPYPAFLREHVWKIDDSVLINNIAINQTLTPAKRKIRKRGKEVLINGKTRWATGDCIRGQLHQETFYGAIKPAVKNENGSLLKDDEGKFIQEENVKYVIRVPFLYKKDASSPGFKSLEDIQKQIVDEGLKRDIEKQVNSAGGLKEAFEAGIHLLDKDGKPHGNKIRHIRVWASVSDPLKIKKQTYRSDKEYKQHYYAGNASNSFFAIYRSEQHKAFEFRNLFDTARIKSNTIIRDPEDLFEPTKIIKKGKSEIELKLQYVLEPGVKILFKIDEHEDLNSLPLYELFKRLYMYTNFEKDGRLNFKYHMEARNKIEENYLESEVDFNVPKPTLRFNYAKYKFMVEGYDFEVNMDGTLKWK